MPNNISGLRLDASTTAAELAAFLDQDVEKHGGIEKQNANRHGGIQKLRAEKNADGSVTLFKTDRATGWWGQLTGLSRQRETARAALDMWFRLKFGPELSPDAKQVLDRSLGRREIETLNVRLLASRAEELEGPPPYQPTLPRKGTMTKEAVTLGDTRYEIRGDLGRGMLGFVREAESETGEKVAIKVLAHSAPAYQLLFEHEFRAHERIMSDGVERSHIVGLKGAISDENGKMCGMVLEHMPGGDADKMLQRLRDAEQGGRISPEQARLVRLTAARDMATGLAQLHEGRGLMHYDVKPSNFLISGDGVVKVADFGTVRPEADMHGKTLQDAGGTDIFMSPEALRAPRQADALAIQVSRVRARAELQGLTKDALAIMAQSQRLQRDLDAIVVNSKADIFSLALSFVNAFEGKHLDEYDFRGQIQALGSDAPDRDTVLTELGITSDSPEHTLIRQMLASNPEERPTAREIMDSSLFDHPEIGSPEIRDLMLKIAQDRLGDTQDGRQQ
ncbi:MAG: serine/threonine-protein kinase [Proteobacteria bacterium]|nr:serine/threonine-protein kinase [Pseudomonadota bacterium]